MNNNSDDTTAVGGAVLGLVLAKLDRIDSRIDGLDVTMAKNTASLEEHVRRTNLLEEELRPVKSHVQLVSAGAKFLSWGAALVSFLIGVGSFILKIS